MPDLLNHKPRENEPGVLYVVGTPIGNLGDITLRALETLKSVDLIAAEDTRHTAKLLNHFSIAKPVTSYFEHNKKTKGAVILAELLSGKNVALVSDAGMPGISDPGADLIRDCIAQGMGVTVVPGPAALLTGLVASGLDTAGHVYAGFFPRLRKEQQALLAELANEKRTLVFYESPHRLLDTLRLIKDAWGDRRCCVARELTKLHEEYLRGPVSEVAARLQEKGVKGEITLMIAGMSPETEKTAPVWDEVEQTFRQLLADGMSRKDAVKETARKLGAAKREIYSRLLKE